MINVGLVIIARMGSRRLPGKHLLPALNDGSTFTQVLWSRIEKLNHPVILATGTSKDDMGLVEFYQNKCAIFQGHDHTVPLRVLEAGRSQAWDAVVSIDGDDVLTSLKAINKVCESLRAGEKLVTTQGLPFGMNAWGFDLNYLESRLNTSGSEIIETGWGRIFDLDPLTIDFPKNKNHEVLRFSLDYPEDKSFFHKVLGELKDPALATDDEILELVDSNQLYKINESVIPLYWENFNAEKAEETH